MWSSGSLAVVLTVLGLACEEAGEKPWKIGRDPVVVVLRPDEPTWNHLQALIKGEPDISKSKSRLKIRLDGVKPAGEDWKSLRIFWEVPLIDGQPDPKALSPTSPHFVGTVGFFPLPMNPEQSGLSFYVDLQPTLKRLGKDRALPQKPGVVRLVLVGVPTKPDSLKPSPKTGDDRNNKRDGDKSVIHLESVRLIVTP